MTNRMIFTMIWFKTLYICSYRSQNNYTLIKKQCLRLVKPHYNCHQQFYTISNLIGVVLVLITW